MARARVESELFHGRPCFRSEGSPGINVRGSSRKNTFDDERSGEFLPEHLHPDGDLSLGFISRDCDEGGGQ